MRIFYVLIVFVDSNLPDNELPLHLPQVCSLDRPKHLVLIILSDFQCITSRCSISKIDRVYQPSEYLCRYRHWWFQASKASTSVHTLTHTCSLISFNLAWYQSRSNCVQPASKYPHGYVSHDHSQLQTPDHVPLSASTFGPLPFETSGTTSTTWNSGSTTAIPEQLSQFNKRLSN